MALSQDFRDLLAVFAAHDVSYVIVGGYAVGFHSTPRFTKDIDIFVGQNPANLSRVATALAEFGAPEHVLEHLRMLQDGEILYLGVPPARIDIFRTLPGVDFDAAFAHRVKTSWDGVAVSIIDRNRLIASKRATARKIDLFDIENLERDPK